MHMGLRPLRAFMGPAGFGDIFSKTLERMSKTEANRKKMSCFSKWNIEK